MPSWRAALVLIALAAGCARDRPRPVQPPPLQPVVLPDVTGHTALLIDHVGRYEIATEPMRDIGMLPQAQLAISPTLSCHATWRADAVEEVPVPESQLVRLQAVIVVEALRQPVLAAYELTWTRMGPVVVGFGGEWGPDLLTPAACPK